MCETRMLLNFEGEEKWEYISGGWIRQESSFSSLSMESRKLKQLTKPKHDQIPHSNKEILYHPHVSWYHPHEISQLGSDAIGEEGKHSWNLAMGDRAFTTIDCDVVFLQYIISYDWRYCHVDYMKENSYGFVCLVVGQ